MTRTVPLLPPLLLAVGACAAGTAGGAGTQAGEPEARPTPVTEWPDRPRVHLIATGGTISNTGGEERLSGDEIAASVPGIGDVARITVEQFSNIPSGSMTPALWLDLARRVEAALAQSPEPAGVVITHGTDTMEETAYFLDLVLAGDAPVLLTGAMRNASRLSHDGPANLFNAVRVAVSPEARGRGVMVVLNDAVLPAREATKLNTVRVEAFEAPRRGPLAIADADTLLFLEPRGAARTPVLDFHRVDRLPRVDIVYTYAGADGALIDAAVAAGARGVVVASVGRGGSTPGQRDAMDRALDAGVFVVVSSRTQSGRVPVGSDEERLEDWTPGRGIRFGAEDLTPQKARVLLMLALARTDDPRELLDIFRAY